MVFVFGVFVCMVTEEKGYSGLYLNTAVIVGRLERLFLALGGELKSGRNCWRDRTEIFRVCTTVF